MRFSKITNQNLYKPSVDWILQINIVSKELNAEIVKK